MEGLPVSPLAPESYPKLPAINGVTFATKACGIGYKKGTDLLLMQFAKGTQVAGVFTQSKTASANVVACRHALKSGAATALIVNSGNSNAFTGQAGFDMVEAVTTTASALLDCEKTACFTASTGVIGEPLPYNLITNALPELKEQLATGDWMDAAQAIMTTDTYPKLATRTATIDGTAVTINGIAKGSGMIAPNMATMLAFIATDAAIPAAQLQAMVSESNAKTFNCITVDSDTSTSDTLLCFATGTAGNSANDLSDFKRALHEILHELALHIVKDGEGAEKLITINVTGAEHNQAAHTIAMAIGNSPLVKTALAANDANWGRIVMAVGKAGEAADRDKLSITVGGVTVAENGTAHPDYKEETIQPHMNGRDIHIDVDVGIADGTATIWTCDLTHRYIDINGNYRT